MEFRSIADESELDLLVSRSGKRDVSARWVSGMLERGQTRKVWCRMALSSAGEVLAAQAFDSWSLDSDPGNVPTFVNLLGHVDEATAVALLTSDLNAFAAETVEARLSVAADAATQLSRLRESQARVLQAAGFVQQVDRVRLAWQEASPTQSETGHLTFRPAREFGADTLAEIFAQVGDGSVDHGMVTGRAESGRRAEAERRLHWARRRQHQDDWFVVGLDSSGTPVGFVQSAIEDSGRPILAEIGVVATQRGHRYVDELLAYGTAVLADHGATRIESDTDAANRAMRAAFARGGYVEWGSRRDYRWVKVVKPPSRP